MLYHMNLYSIYTYICNRVELHCFILFTLISELTEAEIHVVQMFFCFLVRLLYH